MTKPNAKKDTNKKKLSNNVETKTKKRIAAYVRVSTENQAEEGFSIEGQKERLSAYCVAKNWEACEFYVDAGFSGSSLDRPAIQQLIADIEENKISAVLVYKLDRLSRSQKDTLFLLEDIFLPNEIDFISLNESIDTSTAYGRAMIGILSAFAQLERENIFMRTRMGMLERVKRGYWTGSVPPFGYDYDLDQGILVPNKNASTVREVFNLYISGYGPQKIAKQLGLKYEKQVMNMIERRTYIGKIHYNGKDYQGLHEPIISEEIFELAAQKNKQRKRARSSVSENPHLLSGLLHGGVCGARLRYVKWGKNRWNICCYSIDSSKKYMSHGDCDNTRHDYKTIEEKVLSDLFNVSVDLKEENSRREEFNIRESLMNQINRLESKLNRLYNLYADSENEVLYSTIQANTKKLEELKRELNDLPDDSKNPYRAIVFDPESVKESWSSLTTFEQQSIIRDCVEKIIITYNNVQIFYRFRVLEEM